MKECQPRSSDAISRLSALDWSWESALVGNIQSARAALKAACEGTDNLLPPILRCVEAYATVGEICATLEEVFGAYSEPMG